MAVELQNSNVEYAQLRQRIYVLPVLIQSRRRSISWWACGDVEDVQNWAAAALEDIGAPPVDSVDALESLVSSSDPLVSYWAVTLLGRLGVDASRSQVILGKAVSDSPHPSVQERAAWALGKIGATEASVVESLKKAAASDSPRLASLASRGVSVINLDGTVIRLV